MSRVALLVLLVFVGAPNFAIAQANTRAEVEDSLRGVLQSLVQVYRGGGGDEYSRTQAFFADSVSCLSSSSISTCGGWEHRGLSYASSPIRARLAVGQRNGWEFDLESLEVVALAESLAVATVRWETTPVDTTVSVSCDPAQPALKRQVGIWTVVFEPGSPGWMIKHAHESVSDFTQYEGCGGRTSPRR